MPLGPFRNSLFAKSAALVVALCVLLALTACGPHRDVIAKNRDAQARWEQNGLTDYRYHFRRLCECQYDYLRQVSITVSDGEIVDIVFTDNQTRVPRDMWTDFPTVAGMFQKIQAAADGDAHEIRVTYDLDTGYPQSIFIDHDEQLADEETYWKAGDLEAFTKPDVSSQEAVQLQVPQQADGRFEAAVQGCSLLSRDARTVGCYRENLDMGYVEDFLEMIPVGSTKPKVSLHLYSGHMGETFDPATVDGDGIVMANALLQQGGYENVGTVHYGDSMEYRIRQMDGEIVVSFGQREARAPLPAFDPELSIEGFHGDPRDCLYWLPTQLTVFEREAIAAVKLKPIASWNQDPNSECYQQLGPSESFNEELIGPGAEVYLVMAAGMKWPAAQQTVASPTSALQQPIASPNNNATPATQKPVASPTTAPQQSIASPTATKAPATQKPVASPATSTQQPVAAPTTTSPAAQQPAASPTSAPPAAQQPAASPTSAPPAAQQPAASPTSAPPAAQQPAAQQPVEPSTTTAPARIPTREEAVAEITKLGGNVSTDPQTGVVNVTLAGEQFTDATLDNLKALRETTGLEISSSKVTDAGLAKLKGLDQLNILYLTGSNISDAGLVHLQTLTNLKELSLPGRVTDTGLVYVGQVSGLASLWIANSQISDAGLQHLTGLKLQNLILDGTSVSDAGLGRLLPMKDSLGLLRLGGTRVTDAGLVHLTSMKALYYVDLGGTQVTDLGLVALATLPKLFSLGLANTAITNSGLEQLISLTNLVNLNLANTAITDAGLETLKSLPSLAWLNLSGTNVTQAGVDDLKQALPNLSVN